MKKYIGWGPLSLVLTLVVVFEGFIKGKIYDANFIFILLIYFLAIICGIMGVRKDRESVRYLGSISLGLLFIGPIILILIALMAVLFVGPGGKQ